MFLLLCRVGHSYTRLSEVLRTASSNALCTASSILPPPVWKIQYLLQPCQVYSTLHDLLEIPIFLDEFWKIHSPMLFHRLTVTMSENTDQQSQLLPDKEKQPTKDKWTLLFRNTWSFEVLSILFTAACFITLCCLLLVYNLKQSPDLPQGLTLNSIVSILVTAAQSSLLFSVGNAIGQLKWIWSRQGKRQLYDMQAVDDASRGPLGSLTILLQRQHPGSLLLSLGATVMIIPVAFDPFVQQIVSYPVRQVISPSDVATMKQTRFPLSAENTGDDVDDAFDHAMNAGLWPKFLSWIRPVRQEIVPGLSFCRPDGATSAMMTSTACLFGCTDPVDLHASSTGT